MARTRGEQVGLEALPEQTGSTSSSPEAEAGWVQRLQDAANADCRRLRTERPGGEVKATLCTNTRCPPIDDPERGEPSGNVGPP